MTLEKYFLKMTERIGKHIYIYIYIKESEVNVSGQMMWNSGITMNR